MQAAPKIEILLEEVIKKKASDLHLQVGLPPMLRVDGALVPVASADVLNDEAAVETLIFCHFRRGPKANPLKTKSLTLVLPLAILAASVSTLSTSVAT